MKTRETIEALSSEHSPSPPAKPKQHPNSRKNLVAPWKPGQSGNPSGRPKHDMSQVIARAIIEQNAEAIYKAYSRQLLKGGAFAFQVIAERGYGKLKETRDTGADFNDLPDGSLEERVAQLERELYPNLYPGLTAEAGEAARTGIAQGRAEKANGKAQDTHVLPGNGAVKTGSLS